MSLYDPATRREKVAWTIFTLASFALCIGAYVNYLITTA